MESRENIHGRGFKKVEFEIWQPEVSGQYV